MAMVPRVQDLDLQTDVQELQKYQEQRDGFMTISKLCAGTVDYEYKVKQIQALLPSEEMIKKFTEKEKVRLQDQPEEVEKLELNLVKKLESHAKIIAQIVKQVQSAKQFRQTVIDTFGSLEQGSVLSSFIWANLCGQKFTDGSLDAIEKNQLTDIQSQLSYLDTVHKGLTLMNETAINEIAENLKNIVDGGSEDLKKAMKEMEALSQTIEDAEKQFTEAIKEFVKAINVLQRKIDEIEVDVAQHGESEKIFLNNATELLKECESQNDAAQKRMEELNTIHQKQRTDSTKKLQDEMDTEMKQARKAFDEIKNQSAEQQKQHHDERVAEIKARNEEIAKRMKDHEADLEDRLKSLKNDLENPKLPPSTTDFAKLEASANGLIQDGQRQSQISDEYTWFKVTRYSGWFNQTKHTSDERRKTKDNSSLRAEGQKKITKGNEQLRQIAEQKKAHDANQHQMMQSMKQQTQATIDRTTLEKTKLQGYYKPEAIPEMLDQTEALNKKFEETKGYEALKNALDDKQKSITEQLETQHNHEQTFLRDTIKNEESIIIQQALAFISKFEFREKATTLAEVMGQLKEVIDKKSPKQITDEKVIQQKQHDSNDAVKDIAEKEKDKKRCEEKWEEDKKQLEEKVKVTKAKLDTYKDSSPVPLDSLYTIYAVMGNIRQRQDNVENIQQLLPNCIAQFKTRAQMMITGVQGLKSIEVKSDEAVQKELKTRIGARFNKERKDQELLRKWVEEIAGDDEEFDPLILNLNKHAQILPFDKFKKMCDDDQEREKFVEKIKTSQEKKPSKGVPPLDEEQLEQLSNILESMADNVNAWAADYYEEQTPILKYMARYDVAKQAFTPLVEQIRFMPNTKQIAAEIVLEIKNTEEQGQLDYEGIVPANAIEGGSQGGSQTKAIEESKE